MVQRGLFPYFDHQSDAELPHQRHSETSKQAAEQVVNAGTLRQAVLDHLATVGPSTDEQMQIALHMNPSTQRPRRIELVNMGLVRDSGLTTKTNSGRLAVVWELVKGRQ